MVKRNNLMLQITQSNQCITMSFILAAIGGVAGVAVAVVQGDLLQADVDAAEMILYEHWPDGHANEYD